MTRKIFSPFDSLLAELRRPLREIPLATYPEFTGCTRADVHDGLQGQGGLFLASDMAKTLRLAPGMRIMDLGSGRGATAVFLARKYGVRVFAVDEYKPDSVFERSGARELSDLIAPVRADARQLPFAEGFFDRIFCMNAHFYFATDDLYPPYILKFLKPDGEMVIGGPCYRDELTADTPEEFLLEFSACLAVHSPLWWKRHFERSKEAVVIASELHPRGVEFWEDRVKFLLETEDCSTMPKGRLGMIRDILRMLLRDHDGYVSHFILHLRKGEPDKLSLPTPANVTPPSATAGR